MTNTYLTEKRKYKTVQITAAAYEVLRRIAADCHRSMSDQVEFLVAREDATIARQKRVLEIRHDVPDTDDVMVIA